MQVFLWHHFGEVSCILPNDYITMVILILGKFAKKEKLITFQMLLENDA